METDSVTTAAEWDVVPVGRGHEGLRTLAADGFSGGVTDGVAWAMLTNGRVVGIVGGSMESFADADLTAHEAPDPALPLLLVMREQSRDPRAQYYTEETPLSEVDATLRGGGFTGYVELSENVLSGDYYVVYYGGDRLPVAFIGGSRRLVTGDEAFERADDEVGIYGVHDVDVSVAEVPGGDLEPTPGGVAVGGGDATDADEPPDADDESAVGGVAVSGERDETTDEGDHAGASPGSDDPPGQPRDAPDATAVEPDGAATEGADGERATPDQWTAQDGSATPTEGEPDDDSGGDADDTDEDGGAADGQDRAAGTESDPPDASSVSVGDDGVAGADGSVADGTEGADASAHDAESADTAGDRAEDANTSGGTEGVGAPVDGAAASRDDGDDERVAELREEAERLRAERDDLRETLEGVQTERDDLRETLDGVRAERDDLREEIERLRTERDELRERAGGSADGTALTAATALSGTNLFVRYGSKADPTLERALGEGAGREAVDENLSLEVHTSFEREGATVDGRPFDEFLRASVAYRFVEWLVRALPYELRDAAGKRPLGRLYESIPSFDRAEIDGAVAVEGDDADEVTFDVVLRNRKGAPLAVASVFDGREPATEAMLSDLLERARPAAAANESLGAALFVTTSYYAPDALELAESETSGGGLFGRGAKESYVRLDRSHGFHLCLVEARGDDFHLGVPEL